MAPPPPATMPLTQRVLALVQTLQFGWFVGHVSLLLCAMRYGLSWISFNTSSAMAMFTYRMAFISAAATYGIVVYKAYRARMRTGKMQQQGIMALAGDENVQYLGRPFRYTAFFIFRFTNPLSTAMALIWLYSRQILMAMLPFAVYSIFHVATYTRSNILPTLQPQPAATTPGAKPQSSALADTIGRFVKQYYDTSMTLVAVLEILLFFRLLFSAMLFQKGSWVLLVIYTAFIRVRHSQSPFVQGAVTQLTARIDAALANQNTPPAVRNIWEQAKGSIRAAADATDINRFMARQQSGVPQKKAQ